MHSTFAYSLVKTYVRYDYSCLMDEVIVHTTLRTYPNLLTIRFKEIVNDNLFKYFIHPVKISVQALVHKVNPSYIKNISIFLGNLGYSKETVNDNVFKHLTCFCKKKCM